MNDTAFFSYSTEEDLSYVLEFSGIDLTGREFEVKVKDRASNTTRATLTVGSGLTVTGANVFEAAHALADMSGWPTGEYSADVVDVTDGAHSRIMAVRFVRALPGRLVEGVQNRKAFVRWSPNQAVVTATGAIGPAGPPGPQGEQGIQGEPGLDGTDGTNGTNGTNGSDGNDGWSPVLAIATDGARRVLQVDDWVGGEGTKPATGDYIGPTGLTPTIGDAVDIRGPAGTATIDDNAVTDTKLRDSAAVSVIGRSANSSGDPADIVAGTDGHVLRRSGATLGFGQVATAGLMDGAATNAKLADMANGTFKGRTAGTTGAPEDLTASQVRSGLGIGDNVVVGFNYATLATLASNGTVIPFDNTKPQITEGVETLTLAFTPKAIGNKILFRAVIPVIGFASDVGPIAALFLDSTADAIGATVAQLNNVVGTTTMTVEATYTAVDTASHTLRLRIGPRSSGAVYINGNNIGSQLFNGACAIVLSYTEVRV